MKQIFQTPHMVAAFRCGALASFLDDIAQKLQNDRRGLEFDRQRNSGRFSNALLNPRVAWQGFVIKIKRLPRLFYPPFTPFLLQCRCSPEPAAQGWVTLRDILYF